MTTIAMSIPAAITFGSRSVLRPALISCKNFAGMTLPPPARSSWFGPPSSPPSSEESPAPAPPAAAIASSTPPPPPPPSTPFPPVVFPSPPAGTALPPSPPSLASPPRWMSLSPSVGQQTLRPPVASCAGSRSKLATMTLTHLMVSASRAGLSCGCWL